MNDPVVLLVFILGVAVGSFLNVLILRHEKGEQCTGRSACPYCVTRLRWYELVPVVSYIYLKGKCRSCAHAISPQYPLVEVATGLLYVAIYATHPQAPLFVLLLHLLIWATLVVIFVYDLRTTLIPDVFNATFALLACVLLVYRFIVGTMPAETFWWWLASGPLFFLPFYALWKYSDGMWLGLGDGKFAVGVGWYLGPLAGGSALLYAVWIGACTALVFMAMQKIWVRYIAKSGNLTLHFKSAIPFGPYLVIGVGVSFFTHITIIDIFGRYTFGVS